MSALVTDAVGVRASVSLALGRHAHRAVTLLVGVDADVTVADADGERRARAIVLSSDRAHTASCPGPAITFVYDPETSPRVGALARGRALDGVEMRRIGALLRAHRSSLTRPDVLEGIAGELQAMLTRDVRERRIDARVERAVEALRDPWTDPGPALASARISPAHLRALFARDVGVPMRTYRLWHRLLHATAAFARVDATEAAHRAGFADLAHFSRTARRFFGAPPTALGRELLR